jgi:hypothetical protein
MWKGCEDEKEDVSSYWMTSVILKRKYQKPLCRELALEEAMDVSHDRLRNS